MNKRLKFKIFLKDDGYTLIETIISVFLLSLISVTIYTNISNIGVYNLEVSNKLELKLDTLMLRYLLRKELNRVDHPWFIPDYKVKTKENCVKIFYYDGDENGFIQLEASDSSVSIDINNENIFYSTKLNGEFIFKNGFIEFKNSTFNLVIPLGVIIA